MNKGQVIGLTVTALAVVGGVAVFNYFRKPRRNSDGFFNVSGVSANCGRRNSDGSVSYYTETTGGGCRKGFKTVRFFGDREGL
jgi:hypothetical protein